VPCRTVTFVCHFLWRTCGFFSHYKSPSFGRVADGRKTRASARVMRGSSCATTRHADGRIYMPPNAWRAWSCRERMHGLSPASPKNNHTTHTRPVSYLVSYIKGRGRPPGTVIAIRNTQQANKKHSCHSRSDAPPPRQQQWPAPACSSSCSSWPPSRWRHSRRSSTRRAPTSWRAGPWSPPPTRPLPAPTPRPRSRRHRRRTHPPAAALPTNRRVAVADRDLHASMAIEFLA